ncbi:MAG TPA: hypothetical protein EYG74_07905 [Sulfurimonas autotrophica]|nr:hypothetical protein [Sulfurimonas autotrophica]
MSKRDAHIERIHTYAMMTQTLVALIVILFVFAAFVEMEEQMKWAMAVSMIILMIPAFIFGRKWLKAIDQLDDL